MAQPHILDTQSRVFSKQGKTIKHYAAGLPFVRNAQTIEIPFANFGEVTVDRNAMLAYGASIARAVYRYLTENNGK